MKTRLIYFLALLMTGSVLFSCSKDDDDDDDNNTYTFIDQVLQGEIEGDAWTYVTGSAEVSPFDSTLIMVSVTDLPYDNPCGEYLMGNKVTFSLLPEVGVYDLKLDLEGDDTQSLTLYHAETAMNIGVFDGKIEITKVDVDNGIVEGRVVAEYDDDNFVNGNFSVVYCLD